MEKIEHTTVATNGINMHVASIGAGPVILFLHGFPELWYSWRSQLLKLSSLGYRCIAPDLRGFGDTDAPSSPSQYTAHHIVGDLIGLLDSLGINQVFLVGHDWGAIIAWYFCLFRPDRVKALVNTSVPFPARNPAAKPVPTFRAVYGDDYYFCRFQEPGEAEGYFAQVDTVRLMKKFLTTFSGPTYITKEEGINSIPDPPSLPSWLTDEDINYYASKFNKTGFTGGLNYYRAYDPGSWHLPLTNEAYTRSIWDKIIGGQWDRDNTITWKLTSNGAYSTKVAWDDIRTCNPRVNWAKFIWGYRCMPRMSFNAWLIIKRRLPTKDRLFSWGLVENKSCALCCNGEERIEHLFFQCSFSLQIWNALMPKVLINRRPFQWRRELSWFVRKATGKGCRSRVRRALFLSILYYVWKERNLVVFTHKLPCIESVIGMIIHSVYFQHLYRTKSLHQCSEDKWF